MTDDSVHQGSGQRPSDAFSSSLLSRVRANDPAAWRRLAHLCAPLVWSWCRQAGFQPSDAEDFGQEVFVAVYRGIGSFQKDGRRGSFRRWLRTITNNKIRDRLRDHKKIGLTGRGGCDGSLDQVPYGELTDPDEETANSEDAQLLARAMDVVREHFAESTWRAFERQVVDGERAEHVAAELKMSRDAVYLAKSRVLKRLREEFDELGIE